MRSHPFFCLILLLLIGACSSPATENETEADEVVVQNPALDSLISELQAIEETGALPGFAISVFTADSIYFQQGFGYADLESKTPYTVDHVQMIASITKTWVGVALMKAVEEGRIDLDEPINNILPFAVNNPNHPEEVITVRHLATHTSTLMAPEKSDEGYRFETPLQLELFSPIYESMLPRYNETAPYELGEFLRKKLAADGEWYEADAFLETTPGTEYEYSNLGIALLAYILEIRTGDSFAAITEDLLIAPLDLKATTWSLEAAKASPHVTYYNEFYNEVPKYEIITYPDGGLYSSVHDMTTFCQEMMKGLQGESSIMGQASFVEMTRRQYEGEDLTEGLCWDLSFDGLIGHAGNDFGTSTLLFFDPETGLGRILFTNITTETEVQEEAFYGLYNTLFQYDFVP